MTTLLWIAFDFTLAPTKAHVHKGATLEPRPGVMLTVRKRRQRPEQNEVQSKDAAVS